MATVSVTGPKPLIDERDFIPADLEQARQLYEQLIDSGTPVSRARGIVTWLITLPDRRADDPSTNSVRRDYRRELAKLSEPPWGHKTPGRKHAKGAYRRPADLIVQLWPARRPVVFSDCGVFSDPAIGAVLENVAA